MASKLVTNAIRNCTPQENRNCLQTTHPASEFGLQIDHVHRLPASPWTNRPQWLWVCRQLIELLLLPLQLHCSRGRRRGLPAKGGSTFSESFCRCRGRSPCQTRCRDPTNTGTWNLMQLQLRMVDFHTRNHHWVEPPRRKLLGVCRLPQPSSRLRQHPHGRLRRHSCRLADQLQPTTLTWVLPL